MGRVIKLPIVFLAVSAAFAGSWKFKKIKPNANPAQYVRFSHLLPRSEWAEVAANRLTLGATPETVARIQTLGLPRWIEQQLHPESIAENPELGRALEPLASLTMSIHDTYLQYPRRRASDADNTGGATQPAEFLSSQQLDTLRTGNPEARRQILESIPTEKEFAFAQALNREQRRKLINFAPAPLQRQLMFATNPLLVIASDLNEGKLLRGIYSNRQLEQALDDFWFNHFNVFINKGEDRYLLAAYERETIRPHLFGSFYDLLLATAKSPAMLFYLDNFASTGPQAPNARRQHGLNENYGRELLELHTLGVDGGYTQRDVIEAARCFTGWTITAPAKGGEFVYRDRLHDKDQKIVLGHVIPAGGGMSDGLAVLHILAGSSATAHHISWQLAQRFVADDPPPSLVNRMTRNFLHTGGDLRKLTRTMIESPEFWSQGAAQSKVKSPFEMVVSAARSTHARLTSAFALSNQVAKLGEPLYRKVEPNGYGNLSTDWTGSSALLDRMNFAMALTANRIPGVRVNITERNPDAVVRSILCEEPTPQTALAIHKALENNPQAENASLPAQPKPPSAAALAAGLALGSPEFQRH